MTRKPFPFLGLPELSQLEVLEKLEIYELFSFSLISKRSKSIAKCVNKEVETLKWSFDNAEIHSISLKSSRDYFLDLQFLINRDEHEHEFLNDRIPFNGELLKCGRDGRNFCFVEKWSPNQSIILEQSILDQLSAHILEVFKFKKFEFWAYFPIDIPKCFVWNHTKKFSKLYINITDYVPIDHLKLVFEELKVGNFEVNCHHVSPEGRGQINYNFPMTMQIFKSCWTNCLNLESLLNMKCRRVELSCQILSNKELNALIKHWIDGNLENLEVFRMDMLSSTAQEAEILDGIETVEWNEKSRPARWDDDDYSGGRDFRRRGDGVMATVDMTLMFKWCVWYPRYLG